MQTGMEGGRGEDRTGPGSVRSHNPEGRHALDSALDWIPSTPQRHQKPVCLSAYKDGNLVEKDTGEQLLSQQPITTATKIERQRERE